MSWYPATTRRFPPDVIRMAPDLATFDALCVERFDGWVGELREFCAIPSETDQFPDLERAAGWVEERLRAAGAEVTVLGDEGVPALVVGELGSGPRTLIAVQHYDVQPAAPLDLWDTKPYDPSLRDGRLYARGVCDDKGELLHRIQAVEALRDAMGELPCRVRFVVEGEEESDSAHLATLLAQRPEFFEGDGALIEGGGVDEKGRPQLVCGVRGMVYAQLSVRTLGFDAHSGGAQLLPNAAWRLIEALATLRAPDGTVTIDGFQDDLASPTQEQLDHLRTLPFEEEEIKRIYAIREFVGGLTGRAAQIADTFRPTCNISGISSGGGVRQGGYAPDPASGPRAYRRAAARAPRSTWLPGRGHDRLPWRASVLDAHQRPDRRRSRARAHRYLRGAATSLVQRRRNRADAPGLCTAPAPNGDAGRRRPGGACPCAERELQPRPDAASRARDGSLPRGVRGHRDLTADQPAAPAASLASPARYVASCCVVRGRAK